MNKTNTSLVYLEDYDDINLLKFWKIIYKNW